MREEKIREIEVGQRWHFLRSKKHEMDPPSLGASYRVNMVWVVGSRNAATAGKLDHKRSPLKECAFDTDEGKSHSKI